MKIEKKQELSIKDVLNILSNYKWSIIFITILFTLLGYGYIYTKESTYISYSIIKVKANKKNYSSDIINSATSTDKSEDVLEEITLLKTFKINNQALKDVDFKVRYFTKHNYKKTELYGEEIPLKITNIKIFNHKFIGKLFKLIPTEKGFTLHYEMPYKAKLREKIFKTKEFKFKDIKNNSYGKEIVTKDFSFIIHKKLKLTEPIYIIINGERREIFENLILNALNITQLEKDTSLIKISYEDTIPERANEYVNALTKSFINYSIESKNTQNSKTLNFITEELKNIKKELKASEERLELHQVQKNIVEPSVQATLYIKKLSDIEIDISENNLKKKLILNLIEFVNNNYNLDAIAPSISKLDDKNTLSLIEKLQNLQSLEEELADEYTDEYPKLKTTRKQILSIRNKIIYNLKTLHTDIDYKNRNLQKRRISYENEMKKLPSKERELVNIKRNYEVKSKMYEYLLKKKSENKIIQLATFSNYQIIDEAYCSNHPVKPKRLIIIIISLFLGLITGITLAFIRYTSNNVIQNKNELEEITELPIYGTIPHMKQPKNKIQVHLKAKTPFVESLRTLRTNLQFVSQKDEGTTILITSTIAGEGKSTISANLATILEMAKYKTIVVNFDLRKPTLHKFFEINNEQGLSTYLSGESNLEDIIVASEFAQLDIIPSGPIPLDPSELVLSKKLPSFFKELKKRYEYIIIDTAPIGIVSDTKSLMQYSDLNLIIIREDYAKKEFLSTLEEMIEKHNFKNIGLILNASKAKGGEYGYGYSYEYEDK